jgi:hypothetical protein
VKRTALMMAVMMTMLTSIGVSWAAAQETISPAPASPVEGGKAIKSKTKAMTAAGAVKTVAADSLAISDDSGKDWTFVIDATTKVIPSAKEAVDAGTASPVEGGKAVPSKPATGKETIDVAPASPVEGGKVIPGKKATIGDIKEGQRVQVSYHTVDGKMHATQVRVM